MFKNYLLIAVRSLFKNKLYTLINIFGLALGLAACLAVIGHTTYELSFEDCHKNKGRIYRVNSTYTSGDTLDYSSLVMPPLGPAIEEEIPEVENFALLRTFGGISWKDNEAVFNADDARSSQGFKYGGNVLCASPGLLKIFTLPLAQGNPETVLNEPFSMLITERAAEEYFHGQDPMGKSIKLDDESICTITGVLRDIPPNTQLYCDFIISYSTLKLLGKDVDSWDQSHEDFVYLLLHKNADPRDIEPKIAAIARKYMDPQIAARLEFEMQPLKDIYFSYYGSGRWGDISPHGEASVIYIIGILAVFIMLLAIANFVNLSTARSSDRMREVGVRKVFGAFRSHLIKQFLGESIMITFLAVILGLIIYEIFKLIISPYLPREMLADFYGNALMFGSLIALIIVVGLLSGFYPALYLSRFKPIAVLQGKTSLKSSKSMLRKALIVFQFTIAIGFICCTVLIVNQLNYINSMDLGFDKDNMLLLDFEGEYAPDKCALMKNEILSKNRVVSVTAVNNAPGRQGFSYYGFYTDVERENQIIAKAYLTDYDFLPTFGLEIIKGRGFSEDRPDDIRHSIIINEAMVKQLEIENPIGLMLYGGEKVSYEVIGVVRDFHGTSLDWGYRPLSVIMLRPEQHRSLVVKLPPENIPASIADIQETWKSTFPGEMFTYTFLDDEIMKNYSDDWGTAKMMFVLAVVTVLIACLGIFSLVSYTAGQRTKEIGIRKVLGASIPGIIKMLSREFIVLIVIANMLAWPLAYLFMSDFLKEFAFRVGIRIDSFLMVGLIGLALALLSGSYQALKAALANPVDSLRHE